MVDNFPHLLKYTRTDPQIQIHLAVISSHLMPQIKKQSMCKLGCLTWDTDPARKWRQNINGDALKPSALLLPPSSCFRDLPTARYPSVPDRPGKHIWRRLPQIETCWSLEPDSLGIRLGLKRGFIPTGPVSADLSGRFPIQTWPKEQSRDHCPDFPQTSGSYHMTKDVTWPDMLLGLILDCVISGNGSKVGFPLKKKIKQ